MSENVVWVMHPFHSVILFSSVGGSAATCSHHGAHLGIRVSTTCAIDKPMIWFINGFGLLFRHTYEFMNKLCTRKFIILYLPEF